MKRGCLPPQGLVPRPSPHLPHSLTLISSGSGLCLLWEYYVHTDAAIKSHQCPQSPHSPSLFDLKRDTAEVNLLIVLCDYSFRVLYSGWAGMWKAWDAQQLWKWKTKQLQRKLKAYEVWVWATNRLFSVKRDQTPVYNTSQAVWQYSGLILFNELAQWERSHRELQQRRERERKKTLVVMGPKMFILFLPFLAAQSNIIVNSKNEWNPEAKHYWHYVLIC